MSRLLAFGLLMLTAFLHGCSAPGNQAVAPMSTTDKAVNPVFATQLAGPHTYLPPMPTAVVILKPDDMARNRSFCSSVMKLPTAQEAMAKSVVAPNLVLTRWLSQLNEVPPDRVRDCEFLVGTYDYNRAAALMASLRGTAGSVSGRGPFLAFVIPDAAGLRVAAVDGSGYQAEDFDRFVASWGEAVDRTQSQLSTSPDRPGLVRSVFDLVFAVLRTVFGATAGLIQGTVAGM